MLLIEPVITYIYTCRCRLFYTIFSQGQQSDFQSAVCDFFFFWHSHAHMDFKALTLNKNLDGRADTVLGNVISQLQTLIYKVFFDF